MELTKETLSKVVRAARKSISIANGMRSVLGVNGPTCADDVASDLIDFLFVLSEDTCGEHQSFNDTITMKLLMCERPDDEVAEAFMGMIKKTPPVQPAPNIMDKASFRMMVIRSGGYIYKEGRGKR